MPAPTMHGRLVAEIRRLEREIKDADERMRNARAALAQGKLSQKSFIAANRLDSQYRHSCVEALKALRYVEDGLRR